MKGISAVVAMVLLLIITVAVAGMGQMFISGFVRTITPSEEELPGLIEELLGGGDGGGNETYDNVCDFRLALQGNYTDFDLSGVCVDNFGGISMHSFAIRCKNVFPGYDDPVLGFIGQTETQIRDALDSYAADRIDDNTTGYLLLNCENPIHPKSWGWIFGDNETLRALYFNATKLRINVVKEKFPNATVSFGPSLRGHRHGKYNNAFLTKVQGYVWASEAGVFDEVDCLEPRVFHTQGPLDGNVTWMEDMTRQTLEASSANITRSNGDSIPMCVVSSVTVFGDSDNYGNVVDEELARQQVEIIQEHDNVTLMVWWTGISVFENLIETNPGWFDALGLCDYQCAE